MATIIVIFFVSTSIFNINVEVFNNLVLDIYSAFIPKAETILFLIENGG